MTFRLSKETKLAGMLCLAIYATLTFVVVLLYFPSDLTSYVPDTTGLLLQSLTYSAGHQGFLFTLALLMSFSAYCIRQSRHKLHYLVQLGLLLVLSFGAKSVLKEFTQSPRPYTETLTQLQVLPSPQSFYSLSTKEKDKRIQQVVESISEWRTKHWIGETDYSFPSGHTIFASICVLFFGGILFSEKRYLATFVLVLWAVGVAGSRLWLGMHRPVDLYGSMLFALLLYTLVPYHYPVVDKLLGKLKNH